MMVSEWEWRGSRYAAIDQEEGREIVRVCQKAGDHRVWRLRVVAPGHYRLRVATRAEESLFFVPPAEWIREEIDEEGQFVIAQGLPGWRGPHPRPEGASAPQVGEGGEVEMDAGLEDELRRLLNGEGTR